MITKQELETIRSKAPLMSEGSISPFQVSRMGKREFKEWEKNKQIRYNIETKFKEQNKTKEERGKDKEDKKIRELESRKLQINSQINTIKDFSQLKTKRDNSLKRTYKEYITELKEINLKLMKGGYKKNE